MRDTRLVIIEGIMGSGKSTLTRFAARQLARSGVPVRRFVPYIVTREVEQNRLRFVSVADLLAGTATRTNPTDAMRHVMRRLPHHLQGRTWRILSARELQGRSERRWKRFVRLAERSDTVNIFDGQFFNGDLTGLMLMDEPHTALAGYMQRISEIAEPLRPVLIYLRPAQVEPALRRIVAVRGEEWVHAQLGWKVGSPYGERQRLSGIDGWIALYEDYRTLCDKLFTEVAFPKRQITIEPGRWCQIEAEILEFLELPAVRDPGYTAWNRLRSVLERSYV